MINDKGARQFTNDLDIVTTSTLSIIIASVENDRLSMKKSLELLDRVKHEKLLHLDEETVRYTQSMIEDI